ncbi:uncharacterized protein BDV17DRAFT_295792 [Aspergillus undulatus]|uniref:uncharacterized protein n=1 Tax=Aspergillus undulatus TaxID=1810928 RepID=UPI003CCCDD93
MFLPAVWWFTHDPAVYVGPDNLDPGRFLAPRNEPDPETETCRYGRRSLAVFDIRKAIDEEGREIEVDVKQKPGGLPYRTEFQVRVEAHSEKAVQLIRDSERKVT